LADSYVKPQLGLSRVHMSRVFIFTNLFFFSIGSISYTTSTLRGSDVADPSRYDDSIEEMASMLLDDTDIDQPRAEPGRRLSHIATSKALSHSSSRDSKTLPQLPQLLFNGDDAWAMRTTPVVTAAGGNNEVHFSFEDEAVPGIHTANIPKPFKQPRKDTTPPIPRRSSKRKSGRPKASSTQLDGLGYLGFLSSSLR